VEIFSPASKIPFQSGRTDKNGRFCFFPDTPGKWKIVVDDEIGHRLELQISVNKKLKVSWQVRKHEEFSIPVKILVGISFIFGIFGILSLWKTKAQS